MLPKDTPYLFDSMPEENYFGEFRELSNSIEPFAKKDKDSNQHDKDKDNEDPDDIFNGFSIFPMD